VKECEDDESAHKRDYRKTHLRVDNTKKIQIFYFFIFACHRKYKHSNRIFYDLHSRELQNKRLE